MQDVREIPNIDEIKKISVNTLTIIAQLMASMT